tara:strand:+ start:6531 stop:6761 length:231 start_codon:yes stop_codon:yes gene_type:complete
MKNMKKNKKLTYDDNRNPVYVPSSPVVHDKKWRKETSEHFRKKHGAWWVFTGISGRQKVSWIDQFKKKETRKRKAK